MAQRLFFNCTTEAYLRVFADHLLLYVSEMVSTAWFIGTTVLFILYAQTSAQRCSDKADINYISCNMGCVPAESSLDLIDRCDALSRFGCKVQTCAGSMGFECAGSSSSAVSTCGNSNVVLKEVDPSTSELNFRLDLNTPPLRGDYYFLLNARHALRPMLASIQQSIVDFIDSVNGTSTARFGLGIYRNEDMLDMGFHNVVSLTNNHNMVRKAVHSIVLDNANGGPDANLQALYQASMQPFAPDAFKMIFMLGDTPGHEPSKVNGVLLTRETVAMHLKDRGIRLGGISYHGAGLNARTSSFGLDPAVKTRGGQADYIANETGGRIVGRANSVFEAFWKAKVNVDRTYKVHVGECAPYVDIAPGSISSLFVSGGRRSAISRMTLKLKKDTCLPFTCRMRVTENNLDVESLTLINPMPLTKSCDFSR